MFSAAKDAVSSRAARAQLNNLLSRYCEVRELRIDSDRKKIDAICILHGESETVVIHVGRYDLESTPDGKKKIFLRDCVCNRTWLQNILVDLCCNRGFELPGWAAVFL